MSGTGAVQMWDGGGLVQVRYGDEVRPVKVWGAKLGHVRYQKRGRTREVQG